MTPHYKIIEVGGKELAVFYPQYKDDDGYKIIDPENRFPIELKNHTEYMSFLETLVEREQELKDGLTTLADLIEEMDMLARGPKGDARYMWIKYADDEKGNGMSDEPTGKKYIGFAFNKDTETPSEEPNDYTWARYYPDLTDIKDELQTVKESLNSHVKNKNNPHEVTKAQVGLGNVQNYGIASQSQAENGTSNSAYMTPLRTKQAIEALGGGEVIMGENENGTYEKYPSGLMICRNSFGAPSNIEVGGIYRSESIRWDFPQEFIDDNVTVTVSPRSLNRWGGPTGAVSTDGTTIRIYSATSVTSSYIVVVTAIGRWK